MECFREHINGKISFHFIDLNILRFVKYPAINIDFKEGCMNVKHFDLCTYEYYIYIKLIRYRSMREKI